MKNRMAFGIIQAMLVLFSSCMNEQRVIPIASIPMEAYCIYCIHCENFNSGLIAVSGHTLSQTPFVQPQEIPIQETVFEFKAQESIITTSPIILPTPSPYARTATSEDSRPAVIVPQTTARPVATVPQTPARSAATVPQPASRTQVLYRVQVGAFNNTANAQRNFNQLQSAGFNPILERSGTYTRVVIPRVESQNLTAMINRLNNAGFVDTWVRREL
jgi:cell division septation protein DedD